ncbi:hypothetical protein [Halomonas sp. M20]|uniref:hypothetical protein n=1 Tax=Halomonas sp. M20 TaxID=2763264 RepID=UPI001D09ABF3|nr:hypothetical protein [Halomonas sp. M20]
MTTRGHLSSESVLQGGKSFTEHVQGPGIVHQMAVLEPVMLNELISDLKAPLNANFECAVETILDQGELPSFDAAGTLLPAMLGRFGLTPGNYDTRPETLAALVKTCRGCTKPGRCWQTLRSEASTTACRKFCPSGDIIARDAARLTE